MLATAHRPLRFGWMAKATRFVWLPAALALGGATGAEAAPAALGCGACHESTSTAAAAPPLWSASAGAPITAGRIGGARLRMSQLCLSCHDGAMATGVAPQASGGLASASNHPVGVPYAVDAFRHGLRDASIWPSGLGGTIAEDLLVDGRVECVSCHTTHDEDGGHGRLRVDNLASALCLTCHDK